MTKTLEQRALEACAQYVQTKTAIADCAKRIGEHLELCNGLKGFRRETERHAGHPANDFLEELPPYDAPTERSHDDQDTHLKHWYTADGADEDGQAIWPDIDKDECPHCYAAHLVVQERKALRLKFGAAKRFITVVGKQASQLSPPPHSRDGLASGSDLRGPSVRSGD